MEDFINEEKICIVLCLGCIGTVSVVGCSNKNFDSKVTGDNQTTTENVSDILNDQEKKKAVTRTSQVVMLMTKRTQRTIQKCWQMQICVELFWNFQTQDVISA